MTEIANTIVNTKPYNYETHYLPHDAEVTEYTTGTTRIETARKYLKGNCVVVPKLAISDGINAVRDMFPNSFFDEGNCAKGLSALSRYKREFDEKNGVFKTTPKHDQASNGSDAFRYCAVIYNKTTAPKQNMKTITRNNNSLL